jgi:flagellar basal-body rod protein FlgC
MTDFTQALSIASSGMRAQADRLRLSAENMANIDTPGYRRKLTSFEAEMLRGDRTGAVRTGPVNLDRSDLTQVFDPSHPLADESGHYDGSNVDLVVEIADAREAQRSYEANLRMFDQARQMSQSLNELLRR